MIIIGNGVDIVENRRIFSAIKNKKFVYRIFSIQEIKDSKSYKNKANYYAKRFAAKEAFLKALGTGLREGIEFKDISVKKSKIGNNVFLGGDALIGHHNIIKDHVLIGGNVSLGGSVVVEEYASIGVGASVKPGVTIGKGSIVGVGAAVIKDVSPHSVVVGVPAKEIKKK